MQMTLYRIESSWEINEHKTNTGKWNKVKWRWQISCLLANQENGTGSAGEGLLVHHKRVTHKSTWEKAGKYYFCILAHTKKVSASVSVHQHNNISKVSVWEMAFLTLLKQGLYEFLLIKPPRVSWKVKCFSVYTEQLWQEPSTSTSHFFLPIFVSNCGCVGLIKFVDLCTSNPNSRHAEIETATDNWRK